MDTLYLDFSDYESFSVRSKTFGILIIIIVSLLGIIACLIEKSFRFYFYTQLFLFLYGIFKLTPYFFEIFMKNKPFIKIDNESIEFKITPLTIFTKRVEWNSIARIIMKPRVLYLETADCRKKKIKLSWISTRNVRIIKETVVEFASSKGVTIDSFST